MAAPGNNRLYDLVEDAVTALKSMGKEFGHRRDYKQVTRHLYDVGLESDFDQATVQVALGDSTQPSEDGFDYSNTHIRRQDELIVRAHLGPDKLRDGSLDMIRPILDFEADVEAVLMADRHRGDDAGAATTYYARTVRKTWGDAEGIAATVDLYYVIDWYHTTGDTSAV